jgi:hypothetical protein
LFLDSATVVDRRRADLAGRGRSAQAPRDELAES